VPCSSRFFANTVILLTLFAWVLPAAAATLADDGITLTPTQITQGKADDIEVKLSTATTIEQLSLSPGGPVLKQKWSLPHPGQDLVWDDSHIYIAAGAGGLLIINRDNADYPLQGRLSFGDAVHKLSIAHGHAWLGTNSGIYTADIRDPESPRIRAYMNTRQPVSDIATTDEYAVIASGQEIRIYDSRKPGVLTSPMTLHLQHPALAVDLIGNRLYIAEGDAGVESYLINIGQAPQSSGRYQTTGPAVDIQAGNDVVAVALRANGLLLLDAQGKTLNWLGSHQQTGDVTRLFMDRQSRQIIVGNQQDQVMLVDIGNPQLPSVIASRQLATTPTGLQLDSEQLMVLDAAGLQQIDFSFTPPIYSNEGLDFGQGVNYGGERRVYIRDNIAYVADWFSGIHLYDISMPDRPRLLSTFHTDGSSKGIIVRGDYAYVGDDDHGLQIINIKDPRKPRRVAELATPGLAYIPVLVGDRLYLAGHRGGFQIIDVSNPEQPRLLGDFDTQGKTWAIRVRDNIAFIADDDSGLMMFDVSDPNNIQWIGQFSPGGAAEDVILDGNIAYVAFFDRGVYAIDIKDPGYPKKIAHIPTPGNARGLVRNGNLLYIADWLSGIQIHDVSTPAQPRFVGSYDTVGAAWGLAVVPPYAYVMDWWGGFSVLNITDPEKPTLAGRYHQRDRIYDITTRDNVAFAASGTGGLQIYDIKNPLNPTWMTGVDLDSPAIAVVTNGDRAYVAMQDRHIAIVDISNPFMAYTLEKIRASYPVTSLQIQGDWLLVGHNDRGATLYRINGKYADDPDKERYYKQARQAILTDDGQQLVTAGGDDGTVAVYTPGERKTLRQIQLQTQLLRPYRDAFISYSGDSGISIIHADGSMESHMLTDTPVVDMQVRDSTLYLLDNKQRLITVELDKPSHEKLESRYQILGAVNRITAGPKALYFSGAPSIVALNTLPAVSWEQLSDDSYVIHSPDDLPTGDYDLRINNSRYANALSVVLQKFSKPKFTLDDLKKALDKIHKQQQQ